MCRAGSHQQCKARGDRWSGQVMSCDCKVKCRKTTRGLLSSSNRRWKNAWVVVLRVPNVLWTGICADALSLVLRRQSAERTKSPEFHEAVTMHDTTPLRQQDINGTADANARSYIRHATVQRLSCKLRNACSHKNVKTRDLPDPCSRKCGPSGSSGCGVRGSLFFCLLCLS